MWSEKINISTHIHVQPFTCARAQTHTHSERAPAKTFYTTFYSQQCSGIIIAL